MRPSPSSSRDTSASDPTPSPDPAFMVTRRNEDFITWVDDSKIGRKILKYNDKVDDFDLL